MVVGIFKLRLAHEQTVGVVLVLEVVVAVVRGVVRDRADELSALPNKLKAVVLRRISDTVVGNSTAVVAYEQIAPVLVRVAVGLRRDAIRVCFISNSPFCFNLDNIIILTLSIA